MSNYLNKIVYLTDDQYDTLKTTNSITVNNTTYQFDPNTLYITNTNLTTLSPSVNGTASQFITDITQDKYGKISASKANLDTSGTWSGIANKATNDSDGKPISSTYYKLDGSNTGTKLQISTQSAAYANGIQFMNSTTKKGSMGADNNGTIGIYGTKVVLRPQLDASTKGVEVTTAAMYPTDSMTLGTTSNKWSTVYATTFDGALTGNADTATAFSSGTTVKLTGDTTGESSSSTKGWEVATTTKFLSGTSETSAAITTSPGTGKIKYSYNVSSGTAGLFSVTSNANSIITLNRHNGNYDSQLGFSSNGKIYYRNFNASALDTTTAWKQIAFTDSNVASASSATTASKISAKLATTTKTYLLGTSTTITATAADVDVIGDTGVYLTTTAGQLNATTYLVNEKVRMEYNSTDQSLDFIFI